MPEVYQAFGLLILVLFLVAAILWLTRTKLVNDPHKPRFRGIKIIGGNAFMDMRTDVEIQENGSTCRL